MQVTVVASARAPHQLSHQAAMAQGLGVHGVDVVLNIGGPVKTKHVACWGWRMGRMLREKGHEVLVMERGYLGDRFAWTSLAWNGLNGRGQFPECPADGERFEKHFSMEPWKQAGDYVLLMGQVPGDASLQGRDLMPWYSDAALKAQNAYEMPVKFRPHPRAWEKGYRKLPACCTLSEGSLDEALDGAAFAVTWNSNSGVDAVLAGVPTVTMDEGSMAREVTAHRIGDIKRPDRTAWANRLAWKQWTLEEITSGVALERLLQSEVAKWPLTSA